MLETYFHSNNPITSLNYQMNLFPWPLLQSIFPSLCLTSLVCPCGHTHLMVSRLTSRRTTTDGAIIRFYDS